MEELVRVRELLMEVDFPPQFLRFFDVDSTRMLAKKIEVLEAMKAGRSIEDIPEFYDILELMPDEGIWD